MSNGLLRAPLSVISCGTRDAHAPKNRAFLAQPCGTVTYLNIAKATLETLGFRERDLPASLADPSNRDVVWHPCGTGESA